MSAPLVAWLAPGASLAAIALGAGGAFLGLALVSGEAPARDLLADANLRRVVGFTLYQAALSTLIAVGLAVPLARALARQDDFAGRMLLLRLLALPPVLPALVAVLGIVTVYGGNGWLNRLLETAGVPARVPLYGLPGILLAHVFFNLPLATRLLLQAWQAVPGETWRLAAQLGMDSRAIFALIERPLLRRHLPGIAAFVFLLCVLSFTTVLTLGGGPAATTIEVAIYQALRFDFEPLRAAALALVQLALCLALVAGWQGLAAPMALGAGHGARIRRPDRASRTVRLADAAIVALAAAFVSAPLAAVAVAGITPALPAVLAEAEIWRAAALSATVAVLSAALAAALAAGLLAGARTWRGRRRGARLARNLPAAGVVVLAMPPFVLGTGWFVLLRGVADPVAMAIPAVVAVNALMGLPYVVRALDGAIADLDERYGRLSASLGLRGWTRFRIVDWHHLRRPLALALGFCVALSLGDFGVIALFGGRDAATLPLVLYQRMGAYRIEEAAAIGLLLAALCLGAFALMERAARWHD